jgi:ATP-dependent helicase YprA (DUF1998 family)
MEHALVNGLPLVLLCDRRDIGSTHDVDEGPLTRIYLYDWTEGGSGLSEKAFHLVEGLLQGGRTLLGDCPCAEGCPNCVQMSGCALANNHLDKLGGLALMQGRSVTTSRSLTRISDDEGHSRPLDPRERKSRLRQIAEDELRHQFGKETRATIELGALMDLSGEGLVIVQAVDGARVQVQPLTGGQNTWVLATDLRRLGA